jgi:hypothetical protein
MWVGDSPAAMGSPDVAAESREPRADTWSDALLGSIRRRYPTEADGRMTDPMMGETLNGA